MSAQQTPTATEPSIGRGRPRPDDGASLAATLLAGPIVWGGVGALVDHLAHTGTIFLPIGILIGAVAAIYLVVVRTGGFGGADPKGRSGHGA